MFIRAVKNEDKMPITTAPFLSSSISRFEDKRSWIGSVAESGKAEDCHVC